jgi:glutathione-regulated potassium-efflux system protein KefB
MIRGTPAAGRPAGGCASVEDAEAADRIVELVKSEFPQARLLVRAFDRVHSIRLIRDGVDYQIRETFESALILGEATLRAIGVSPEDAAEIGADVRRRDAERLELQVAGDIYAGRSLLAGAAPVPTPLIEPRRESQALSEQTAAVASERESGS